MGEATIKASSWRLVEVGRVALFTEGPYEGHLAAIVQIIDHKRVLVDNPTTSSKTSLPTVPRHSAPLAHLTLTHIVIEKLPRAAGTGAVKKAWEASEVDKKWNSSEWAQKRAKGLARREMSDFERFKLMRARKVHRFHVRKEVASVKAAS